MSRSMPSMKRLKSISLIGFGVFNSFCVIHPDENCTSLEGISKHSCSKDSGCISLIRLSESNFKEISLTNSENASD